MANRKRFELIEHDDKTESEHGESRDDYLMTSDITEAAKCKCVSGILSRLSPMKTSRNNAQYFDVQLTDGKNMLRMVGFDKRQREKMEELVDDEVTLKKCDLFKNDRTKEMEIIITNRTDIIRSPTKLNVTEMPTGSGDNIKQIMLKSVNYLAAYSVVNVKGNVTSNSSSKTRGAAAPRTRITCAYFLGSEEPSLKLSRLAKLQRMNSSPNSNCRRSKSAIFISRNINSNINSLLRIRVGTHIIYICM